MTSTAAVPARAALPILQEVLPGSGLVEVAAAEVSGGLPALANSRAADGGQHQFLRKLTRASPIRGPSLTA